MTEWLFDSEEENSMISLLKMETYSGTTVFCCGNAFFFNLEIIPEFISKVSDYCNLNSFQRVFHFQFRSFSCHAEP